MKRRYKGLISAFVMIMFGLIAVCYLMGFDSAWGSYTERDIRPENEGGQNITQKESVNVGIGDMMINGIYALFESANENPLLAIVGTIATAVGMFIVGKAGGAQAFAYIIPIVFITIFANIFIFPISPVSEELGSIAGGLPVDIILMAFFNLFLFLAIIDFITGRT